MGQLWKGTSPRVTPTPWHVGDPTLRLSEGVRDGMASIARLSPSREVQVLLLAPVGDLDHVNVFWVTHGQRNSYASISVSAENFAESVAKAKELFPDHEVVGVAHLHPKAVTAYASHVDHENLGEVAEPLRPFILRRRVTEEPVTFQGELADLDAFGRKRLVAADAETPAELSFRETRIYAHIWSVTFAEPRDSGGPLDLHGEVMTYAGCSDPSCATLRERMIDGVPVEVVPDAPDAPLLFDHDELRAQLKARVTGFYGGTGGRRWTAADDERAGGVSHDDDATWWSGKTWDIDDDRDQDQPDEEPRLLRGDESLRELAEVVDRFGAEVAARLEVLAARGGRS